jgi:NADH-quinone oxidoreductase subunit G
LSEAVDRADFVIVQELFLTETAKMADIVLPALPYIEREGSYTTGERRVQRFYPAAIPAPDVWPDYAVVAQIAERLELSLAYKSAPQVFLQIAEHVPGYAGLTYQKLSEVTEQWPIIGRKDLYYGGTSYDNHQGLGVHLDMLPPDTIKEYEGVEPAGSLAVPSGSLKLVPTTRLYDRSRLVLPSHLLEKRIAGPSIRLHPKLAETFGFSNGDTGELALEKDTYSVEIEIDPKMPGDVGLVPRSVGIPISQPVAAKIEKRTPKMQKNNEEGS